MSEPVLTPTETITFVVGVIMCIIGVASFVVGMISRAKNDGELANKVDSAIKGIEDIKVTLNKQIDWREAIGLKVEGHTQQISTIFRKVERLENDNDSLIRRIEKLEMRNQSKYGEN